MIGDRFTQLKDQVDKASGGRTRILLAAKHQPPDAVMAALNAGATLIGHNIIQQLTASAEVLEEMGAPEHDTHVIGHVQSNKARPALTHAGTIQTVDSFKTAKRLNTVTESLGLKRNIFIQINSSGTESQFGVSPGNALHLAEEIFNLPHLSLTGLMSIGANTDDETAVRASFETTRTLSETLRAEGHLDCRELSMGMSGDWQIAVDEGSTMIRVGRQVFGERDRP